MILIHHPGTQGLAPTDPANIENRHGTWRAMEEYANQGLIKSLGVSNFRPNHLEKLKQVAKIQPALNQFEVHPLYMEHDTIETCKKMNIIVQAYSPLAKCKPELMESDVIKMISFMK